MSEHGSREVAADINHAGGHRSGEQDADAYIGDLVAMRHNEFMSEAQRAEEGLSEHEHELVDGLNIEDIFNVRVNHLERDREAMLRNARNALDRQTERDSVHGDHHEYSDEVRNQMVLDRAGRELEARARDEAMLLYPGHGGEDDENRERREHAYSILTMRPDEFESLIDRWNRVEDVHRASELRQQRAEERELDESPLFAATRAEHPDLVEMAPSALRNEVQDRYEAALGTPPARRTELDGADKPQPAPAAEAANSRTKETKKAPGSPGYEVEMPDGRVRSLRLVRDNGNGTLQVTEQIIDTKQNGGRRVRENRTYDIPRAADEAAILLDQVRRREKGGETPRLSGAQYEHLYGPMGMQTGEHFQVIQPNGDWLVMSLDPLVSDGQGGYLQRTATAMRYGYRNGQLVEVAPRQQTSDWEHFKADVARYRRLNQNNNGRAVAIPHAEWQNAIANRENLRMINEVRPGDELSDRNGQTHSVIGVENGRIRIEAMTPQGRAEYLLSPDMSAAFAQGIRRKRQQPRP